MTKSPASASRPTDPERIGLALAGGGFLGVAWEIGALVAIEESISGLDLTRMDVYVGVSAGAFIASALANGISSRRLARIFVEAEAEGPSFDPAGVLRPDLPEFARAIRHLRGLTRAAVGRGFEDLGAGLSSAGWRTLQRAGSLLPNGIYDAEPFRSHLAALFGAAGRTDDFRQLRACLRVVATDIDSAETVAFGEPGHDDMPISRAVIASSAVPGLFKPVTIHGRQYVDGALNKTMHASVALREGAGLVICANPLVPYSSHEPRARRVSSAGLPALLSQSVRTAIHSRMTVGMERYAHTHPGADIVLFEPHHDDPDIFFTNMFSVSARRRLCEHAYQRTRADLISRAD
ncbi:MAG: patatin-like phospholipase family protein [Burkholderiaceae bacterium]